MVLGSWHSPEGPLPPAGVLRQEHPALQDSLVCRERCQQQDTLFFPPTEEKTKVNTSNFLKVVIKPHRATRRFDHVSELATENRARGRAALYFESP